MSMVYVNGLDDIVLLLTEWLMILGGWLAFVMKDELKQANEPSS